MLVLVTTKEYVRDDAIKFKERAGNQSFSFSPHVKVFQSRLGETQLGLSAGCIFVCVDKKKDKLRTSSSQCSEWEQDPPSFQEISIMHIYNIYSSLVSSCSSRRATQRKMSRGRQRAYIITTYLTAGETRRFLDGMTSFTFLFAFFFV